MNASFTKNQMGHLVPGGMSYRTPDFIDTQIAGYDDAQAGRGIGRKIADALAFLVALPRRRAVIDELSTLSDRELADIGVARSEIKRVFDPAFVNDRTARGTNYRFLGING
jgi:uncharacterized protein YjiS (DUF1127 family)